MYLYYCKIYCTGWERGITEWKMSSLEHTCWTDMNLNPLNTGIYAVCWITVFCWFSTAHFSLSSCLGKIYGYNPLPIITAWRVMYFSHLHFYISHSRPFSYIISPIQRKKALQAELEMKRADCQMPYGQWRCGVCLFVVSKAANLVFALFWQRCKLALTC